VKRAGRDQELKVTLGSVPDMVVSELSAEAIPAARPEPAAADAPAADAPAANPAEGAKPDALKTGRFTEELAGHDHSYWAYVPTNYNPAAEYALMVWVHPGGDTMEATIMKQWSTLCERRGIILVGPKSDQLARWMPGEAKFIEALVEHFQEKYSIDPQRIVAHSQASGTQMASLLMSRQRERFRGLALIGAPVVGTMPDQEPEFRQQFYFLCGEDDRLLDTVVKISTALQTMKFPVTLTKVKELGGKYPAEPEVEEIGRWVDSLDRI